MKKKPAPKDALTFEDGDKFRHALVNVIEERLIEILCKAGAKVTYLRLEQDYQLMKETIPEDLEKFHSALRKSLKPKNRMLNPKHIFSPYHSTSADTAQYSGSAVRSKDTSESLLALKILVVFLL